MFFRQKQSGRNDEAQKVFIEALKEIELLSPHRRKIKATVELETHLRAMLNSQAGNQIKAVTNDEY